MLTIFFAYLLAISIGVGVDQVHKAKKDCADAKAKVALAVTESEAVTK